MTKLVSHWDADGLSASYLLSFHVDNPKIIISTKEFGDISELEDGDWLVDMHPLEDKANINILDHHGDYGLAHKYNLIYDNKPASLIAWENFKEEIPKSEWWKTAIGVIGDGQPEILPAQIYKECPQLLNQLKTSAYQSYGKWKISYYPIYKLLSSPINAFLRKGDYPNALRLITEAEKPTDVIYDAQAIKAKSEVRSEFEGCVKSCESIDFQHLNVIIFNSKWRMSGYLASALQSSVGDKTIIAINKKDGRGSLRGELSYYWQDKLKKLDYVTCEGHAGFMGFKITKNTETFIADLTEILQ